jgi:copper ion binding protein
VWYFAPNPAWIDTRSGGDEMKSETYDVPTISCGHCVNTIQMELSELEGVSKVEASSEKKQVLVEFDDPATSESIKALLREINYPVAE